jgi:predicted permease
MASILLLIVCGALGVLIARFAKPARTFAQSLNWWTLNVALTALILHLIPTIEFHAHLWLLAVSQWLVFIGACLFIGFIGRCCGWPRERIGALILVCGLGNTSFIGYPLIEALRGEDGLRLAVVADQAGCFIALAIGGSIVAAVSSGSVATPGAIARKLLLFPPFIALVIGTIVGALGSWPVMIDTVLARISATLVPLALFAVGLQLRVRVSRAQLQGLAVGLLWKLLLAPALVFLIGTALVVEQRVLAISVLQSAMAPMISAAILASDHDLDPELANAVLGVGILLSFITVPIAHVLLG